MFSACLVDKTGSWTNKERVGESLAQVHPIRGDHVILYLIASNKVPLFSTFTTLEDVGILFRSGRSILVRPQLNYGAEISASWHR
jgi:hypothetical protein